MYTVCSDRTLSGAAAAPAACTARTTPHAPRAWRPSLDKDVRLDAFGTALEYNSQALHFRHCRARRAARRPCGCPMFKLPSLPHVPPVPIAGMPHAAAAAAADSAAAAPGERLPRRGAGLAPSVGARGWQAQAEELLEGAGATGAAGGRYRSTAVKAEVRRRRARPKRAGAAATAARPPCLAERLARGRRCWRREIRPFRPQAAGERCSPAQQRPRCSTPQSARGAVRPSDARRRRRRRRAAAARLWHRGRDGAIHM